tara:strand:- start:382 stop:561 length:180 start_codon:yes stop_codon:yes gene_type:complete
MVYKYRKIIEYPLEQLPIKTPYNNDGLEYVKIKFNNGLPRVKKDEYVKIEFNNGKHIVK